MGNVIKVSVLGKDDFKQHFVTDKGVIELRIGNETVHIRIDQLGEKELLDRLNGECYYQ